jgi:hypothetical protein
MRLQTAIQPRRDGTVRVSGEAGQTFIFSADQDGDLTCDVDCEATVARLLAGGQFYPANPEDFDAALALSEKAAAEKAAAERALSGANPVDPDDDDDDDDDDPVDPQALPVEANTPPVPARATKNKKAAAQAAAH